MSKQQPTNMLIPAKAIHPGEILKDELAARRINQKEFAKLTGIQATQLNEMIKGKRNINAEIALVIGAALGIDPVIWTNLQSSYDLNKERIAEKTSKRLQAIDLWNVIRQYIPLKYFKKLGILSGDPVKDIPLVKNIYLAANVDALIAIFSQPKFAHFRKSEKLEENKINLLGWQHYAAHLLAEQTVPTFAPSVQTELIAQLKTIISKNKNTLTKVTAALHAAGIKFIVLEQPDKCPVDGVSFRSGSNPAITLTMHHKRLDNFAFTLFHELGHVFLHLATDTDAVFVDINPKEADKDYSTSIKEREADAFARNALIADAAWNDYLQTQDYQKEDVLIAFAKKQKIHPAIVKGRINFNSGNYFLFGKMETVN